MAISARSLASSASSSSSSAGFALSLFTVRRQYFLLDLPWRAGILTIGSSCGWQPVQLGVDRYRAGVEHALVHSLLLQPLQLGIQIFLVGLLAQWNTCDCSADLLAELVLFSEYVPAPESVNKPIACATHCPSRVTISTYIVSSTLSILIPPWICDIAAPACFIACKVS